MSKMRSIPEQMLQLLKAHNADYQVERRSKHNFLIVNGERVCVLSRDPKSTKPQTIKNSAQRLKRLLREEAQK